MRPCRLVFAIPFSKLVMYPHGTHSILETFAKHMHHVWFAHVSFDNLLVVNITRVKTRYIIIAQERVRALSH